MRPPTISIAIDGERLSKNILFRHDFVLAAVAADFEGGEGKISAYAAHTSITYDVSLCQSLASYFHRCLRFVKIDALGHH